MVLPPGTTPADTPGITGCTFPSITRSGPQPRPGEMISRVPVVLPHPAPECDKGP
ncbi:hypothetical protein HMPREF0290_0749 [Corynebacterium efficiens YS-314]|nr:hypothetical protein HMPREF0290_0749 [Corynebacterium efficiens YS-314]